jgi:VWFA-related protein
MGSEAFLFLGMFLREELVMSLNPRIVIPLIFVLVMIHTVQPFQQNNPDQEQVIRVNVNLVQVDATVTNSKDEPVTDLGVGDFMILQDGQPQEITNFAYIRRDSAVSSTPVIKPALESKNNAKLPPPPPMPLKREKVHRTIALVVDDLGISMVTMTQVRQALKKWIDQEMQPDDLVTLILTGRGEGVLQQFTNDKRILYAALGRVQYNAASRVGTTPFERVDGQAKISGSAGNGQQPQQQPQQPEQKGGRDPSGFARANPKEERDLLYTLFTMGSIEEVIKGLKELPGRKDLIFFSESMKVMFEDNKTPSQGRELILKERLQRLIDNANKAAVVIHSIDPRGVIYTGLSAEDNTASLSDDEVADIYAERSSQLINTQDGMVKMAQQTGGLFIQNHNDIDRAVVKAVDDGEGYYLIGYQPNDATVSEMKTGKSKFHDIRVRVKRPGLRVRTRSRFFSTPEESSPPDVTARKERVEEALRSPFAAGNIPVRLTALYSQTKTDKPCINAMLHFDVNPLTFTEEPDGWRKAALEFVAGVYNAGGQQIEFVDRVWNLLIRVRSHENMKKNGLSFMLKVPVKDPGAYQVRLVLRDNRSGKIGSATQFVDVPDIRKNKLALSGIVLAADKTKPKAAIDQEEGVLDNEGSNGTAAVRLFEPGTPVSYAYQILNAKTDKNKTPRLQLQLRLFRDGQEVYKRKPSEMKMGVNGNAKRIIAVDQLQLNQLPPGYYVLQVAVTDMLAEEKDQMAVQSIDFEVRKPDAPPGRR